MFDMKQAEAAVWSLRWAIRPKENSELFEPYGRNFRNKSRTPSWRMRDSNIPVMIKFAREDLDGTFYRGRND